MESRFKIFSDPVHGFISVPKGLILDLLGSAEVQRLRRIKQLGLGDMVFAGAEHTRFGHALGAMALMQEVLQHLQEKGTPITPAEFEAGVIVALLHDIGHVPFSHTLEFELIKNFEHEQMSRILMERLNARFEGKLSLALSIFDNTYHRPFFHQLLSSQMDIDRMDYLRRDAAYTDVSEGKIGVHRILKTMRVHPIDGNEQSCLVFEEKGIYAIENFLLSRRQMYWQVYLHKTVLAADFLLRSILRFVRKFAPDSLNNCSSTLAFFLQNDLDSKQLSQEETTNKFINFDDIDILFGIKQWQKSPNPVLAMLSQQFLHRKFFRVRFLEEAPNPTMLTKWHHVVMNWLEQQSFSSSYRAIELLPYFFSLDQVVHETYQASDNPIYILSRSHELRELSTMVDTQFLNAFVEPTSKWFICYPKVLETLIAYENP